LRLLLCRKASAIRSTFKGREQYSGCAATLSFMAPMLTVLCMLQVTDKCFQKCYSATGEVDTADGGCNAMCCDRYLDTFEQVCASALVLVAHAGLHSSWTISGDLRLRIAGAANNSDSQSPIKWDKADRGMEIAGSAATVHASRCARGRCSTMTGCEASS
jgi:hypothetical protein